eukprot:CAMPEP_0185749964 /NCGR_PEP_ID=MMETSP1174-20130828/8669_1 /TAXON_ID=35687 /ORGANISM="Dictyocha speculum, Strain CCMP1381" /LENGTH=242 /DNA_ID=CAMNT_0028426295 /DNA_START=35 /DNA_END=763 /DNA_ORIENTATION=-
MEEKLHQHPLWYRDENSENPEFWKDMYEGLENFIFKRLHSLLLTPDLKRRDDNLQKQTAALGCITSAQLDVEWAGRDQSEDWDSALSHIAALDRTRTLGEKLLCLNLCLGAITKTLVALLDRQSEHSRASGGTVVREGGEKRDNTPVAADDLLPAVIIVIMRAQTRAPLPIRVISHLEMVSRHKRHLLARDQYCLVTFMSAVEFLLHKVTAHSSRADASEPRTGDVEDALSSNHVMVDAFSV